MHHGRVLPTPVLVMKSRLAHGRWQILVRWEALLPSELMWEHVDEFRKLYPQFELEDELFLGRERCHGQHRVQ
jgi:hypothetical protein